ncbi:response regulator [soil metagenome]
MSTVKKFIVVDDDNINNMLCSFIIETVYTDAAIISFTRPTEALTYIEQEYNTKDGNALLFLDINMPIMNGWEFMEAFEKFSDLIKEHISVYIVSSSVDTRDKEKADANPLIKGFFSKPLDQEIIAAIA